MNLCQSYTIKNPLYLFLCEYVRHNGFEDKTMLKYIFILFFFLLHLNKKGEKINKKTKQKNMKWKIIHIASTYQFIKWYDFLTFLIARINPSYISILPFTSFVASFTQTRVCLFDDISILYYNPSLYSFLVCLWIFWWLSKGCFFCSMGTICQNLKFSQQMVLTHVTKIIRLYSIDSP